MQEEKEGRRLLSMDDDKNFSGPSMNDDQFRGLDDSHYDQPAWASCQICCGKVLLLLLFFFFFFLFFFFFSPLHKLTDFYSCEEVLWLLLFGSFLWRMLQSIPNCQRRL